MAPGVLLGHTYRIDAMLARGGMGEVYRARHAELDTDHAIKIILPELANDQRIVDLFRREASVLRTIRHDAVVSYDGVFRDENGRLYLVMEFADGPSLSKLMRERTFSADEIRQLRDRLADGLAVAHEKGVIHRDISPDNVILPGGQVTQAKIIDFGISKLADPETKTIIGTDFAGKYSYVSPEQLGMFGGQVDGRSDIYSLGLVLVAAAQGEPLDMGASPISVIEARRSVPDLSRVPEALRADLAAMLQPDPADRPQSMRALVSSSGSQSGRRAADSDRRSDRRATDRRPDGAKRFGVVPVVGALAVVVVAAGAAAYWYFPRNDDDTGGGTGT
ncbi:MAG: serine/threonine-protein kinase, partial [Dongiaceae bacterium]